MSGSRSRAGVVLIAGAVTLVAAGPLLAPYDPVEQHRESPLAPPTVTGTVRLMARTEREGLNGRRESHVRLIGVEGPGRVFLLGTDRFGRDRFSRLIAGARVSLGSGALAALLATGLGLLLGGVAGLRGGLADRVVTRVAEWSLAMPWLYLLLAARAALPLDLPPARAFAALTAVIGLAGWARPALLVRGVVAGGRQRGYVEAARCAGASEWFVLRRHLLPQATAVAVTQAAILAPQFTLAEMTLSYFGLGIGEPDPSWGSLLAELSRDHVLQPTWYAAAPLVAAVAVFVAYQRVADAALARAARVAA